MMLIQALSLVLVFGAAGASDSDSERLSAPRLRNPDASAHHVSSVSDMFPTYSKFFKSVSEDPLKLVGLLNDAKSTEGTATADEKDQFDAVMEAFGSLAVELSMSMGPSDVPTVAPVATTPNGPAATSAPATDVTGTPTKSPVDAPNDSPAGGTPTEAPVDPAEDLTEAPTESPLEPTDPTENPGFSRGEETADPTTSPTDEGTGPNESTPAPVDPTPAQPTTPPTTSSPVDAPVDPPSDALVDPPSNAPVDPPTDAPTTSPTASPTEAPTDSPTALPSANPTSGSTMENCPGITREQRVAMILSILDSVADPTQIRDTSLAQGKATEWIISQDDFDVCPSDEKLVQRWAMAVLYFSTGGDDWFQCSANMQTGDNCGNEDPFVRGQARFLSGSNECQWAGISCNAQGCVTEIEFEENNLDGTIPSEIALLSDLAIWGMERGHLKSTIPTEVGRLTNLIFIDLDYNELTGTLSSELLSLQSLVQLDLNNNQLSGNIDGIDQYPNMEFLQLHDNLFTGTVPESLGAYTSLSAFTLHESMISGVMPSSVCDLLQSAGNGGSLTSLIADCSFPNPNIVCTCCTDCRTPL